MAKWKKEYTMAEACVALKVTDKTLRPALQAILEEKGLTLPDLRTGIDKRETVISGSLLQELAARYQHRWRRDDREKAPRSHHGPTGRVAQLETEVARLQRELEAERAKPRMSISTIPVAPRARPLDPTVTSSVPSLRSRSAEPRNHNHASKSKSTSMVPQLPEGWGSLAGFAEDNGTPAATAMKAMDKGRITVTHGLWLQERARVRHALTPEQQEVFLRVYPRRPRQRQDDRAVLEDRNGEPA